VNFLTLTQTAYSAVKPGHGYAMLGVFLVHSGRIFMQNHTKLFTLPVSHSGAELGCILGTTGHLLPVLRSTIQISANEFCAIQFGDFGHFSDYKVLRIYSKW